MAIIFLLVMEYNMQRVIEEEGLNPQKQQFVLTDHHAPTWLVPLPILSTAAPY